MFGILFLLVLISFSSASSFQINGETTKNANHSTTIGGYLTIKNINNSINFTNVVLKSQNGNLSFSYAPFSLNYNEEKNVTYSIVIPAHLSPGVYNYNYIINATNGTINETKTGVITINVQPSYSLEIVSSPVKVYEGTNTTTINVKNKGNVYLNNVVLAIQNGTIKYNILTSGQNIAAGETKTYFVYVDSSTIGSSLTNYKNQVNASSGSVVATGEIWFEKSFCKYGENSSSYIKIVDVEDRSSGDEWEWVPLKDISIRVEVENNADDSKRVSVRLGVYDSVKGKFLELKDGERELEQTIKIKENDEEYFNFEFKLPADLKEESNRYKIYIKAFEKGKEQTSCDSDYKEITIDFDEDFIADIIEMPSLVSCGGSGFISLKVFNLNLGDEEKMRVKLYNSELGINLYSEQFELDQDESEIVSFNFVVPEGKEEKSYRITFYLEHDYRESLDDYREKENLGVYNIKVAGNKCKPLIQPLISAKLFNGTETKVGKDLIVELTIINTLSTQQNFIVSLEGYDVWASSASLEETTFTLGANQSKKIKATFVPIKEGDQEFNVNLLYGINVKEQKISVSINPKEKNFFVIVYENIKKNLTYYLTIAIIILIVLIILLLVIKSAKKE